MVGVYVNERVRVDAAIIAGRSSEMDRAADRTLRAVKSVAASHRLTGAYINGLVIATVPGEQGTGRQVSDRVVSSTDPATLSIEYGHMKRHKNARRVSWVPGQHNLQRGMQMVH
jgi:hypothetical protein